MLPSAQSQHLSVLRGLGAAMLRVYPTLVCNQRLFTQILCGPALLGSKNTSTGHDVAECYLGEIWVLVV